jgi:hypothetical protein
LGDIRLFVSIEAYEVHQRSDKRGVDLISDVLPFGRLWYGEPNAISNAIGYAKFFSRLHHAAFSKKTGSTPGASKTSGDFADPLPSVAAP